MMNLQRIGNYELLGELGRGGMGVVYRGVDSFIKRQVAIKTIYLSEIQEDSERQFLRERLYREAQSAGILSHPNIVTIYQIGEQDDITYIVMEFVEGLNLAQLLRAKEKPSFEALLNIFEQTALALDHAHSQGVIHRDIKPANIIVRSDGVAKITDFGVAKIASQTVTRTGMTLGTPHFMAPEQIQGKQIDGRADQYALGVVVYEIVTGRKPFTAESMTTLIFKIVTDSVDPKRDNPNLSDEAAAVLKKALAKEAVDRFPTCHAMILAFRAAIGYPSGAAVGIGQNFATPTGTGSPVPSQAGMSASASIPVGPPASTQTGVSASAAALRPANLGTQTLTPTPTPAPPKVTQHVAPAANPITPTALPSRTAGAQPPPSAGAATASQQELQPRRTSGSVTNPAPTRARSNKWLVPLAAVVGLAVVAGIFGVIQLFTGSSTPDSDKITSTQRAVDSAGVALEPADSPATSGQRLRSASGTASNQSGSPSAASDRSSSGANGASATGRQVAGGTSGSQPGSYAAAPTVVPPKSAPSNPNPVVSGASLPPVPPPTRTPAPPPSFQSPPGSAPGTRPGSAGSTRSGSQPSTSPSLSSSAPGSSSAPPSATASSTAGTPPGDQRAGASTRSPVFTAPRPIVRVPAIYPAQARKDGVSGSVLLQAIVNEAGQPTAVNVVRGIRPDLDQAAREALAKWRFQPGTIDGKPSESRVNVEISFSLVQDERKPISLKNP